jgi:hypothetical protein
MKICLRYLGFAAVVAMLGTLGCGSNRAPEGTAVEPSKAVLPMGPDGMPVVPGAGAPGSATPGSATPGSTTPGSTTPGTP